MAIYVLLEALGIGPRVSFLIDAYAASSLHIFTEQFEGAHFPGDEVQSPWPNRFTVFCQDHAMECLEMVLFLKLMDLGDTHGNNFCLCDAGAPFRLIDFITPDMRSLTSIQAFAVDWAIQRPFGTSYQFGVLGDPCAAFSVLKSKLDSLPPPRLRRLIYPFMRGTAFTDVLTGPGDAVAPDGKFEERIPLEEFLARLELKFRSMFFEDEIVRGDGSAPMTLGRLIGFTEMEAIWAPARFEEAVAAFLDADRREERVATAQREFDAAWARVPRTEAYFRARLEISHNASIGSFDDFWAFIEGVKAPAKVSGTKNRTANYGLAMLRYFRICVVERLAHQEGLFEQGRLTGCASRPKA
jgi:hypothetical protein